MGETETPRVGLAIILMDSGRVLLGKRRGAHGVGTWAFPGGKLNPGENFYECLERELKEETGLNAFLRDKAPSSVTNDIFPEGIHYVTLFFRMGYMSGEARVLEPDKCEEWRWYAWKDLTGLNLFLPVHNLLKQGYNPFRTKQ